MIFNKPLVTIGIPTFNRAALLRRSIESALSQDYLNIEVIVSDNASNDDTQLICEEFRKKFSHFECIRQSSNIGAAANFTYVLNKASGEYFMWLGDDDWIDTSYISECMSIMVKNLNIALVSGTPIYYRNGLKAEVGKVFDLPEKSWAIRVAQYYRKVADNGMFYGLMRTSQLKKTSVPNVMGGDWHLLANIISNGKSMMNSNVIVHRELGGATESYQQMAKSQGLPAIYAYFPMTAVAFGAWKNIVFEGMAYRSRNIASRIILANVVFFIIIAKPIKVYMGRAKRLLRRFALSIVGITKQ